MFSDNGATLLVKWTPARTGDNEARVKLGCLGREPGSREKREEKEWDNRKEKEAERSIMEHSNKRRRMDLSRETRGNATDKI